MSTAKTILITGCSSGLGRLTAELLAQRGHAVLAGMRDTRGRNAAVAEHLNAWSRTQGLVLTVIELDVTDDSLVSMNAVTEQAGTPDVLINNAGLLGFGVTEAFTLEQVRGLFEVNCFAAHRMARAVLPAMRRRGSGLIIQVSSSLARCPLPFFGVYCASKAALEALSESMREEVRASGVEVVLVEPGPYSTGIGSRMLKPDDVERAEEYDRTEEQRLAGRFQELTSGPAASDPREVAEAIAHLIDLPPGRRPLRTAVGPGQRETQRWNEAAALFQQQARAELGLVVHDVEDVSSPGPT